MKLPNAMAVRHATQSIGLHRSVAEVHGSVVGWCAAGGGTQGHWLAEIFTDPSLPYPDEGVLVQLLKTTIAQLNDPECALEILLTEQDAEMALRCQCLFEWCQAFLGGFGLVQRDLDLLSADSQEALNDLAQLARTRAEDIEPAEDDDQSFEEIIHFVRLVVLLLCQDCKLHQPLRPQLH